MERPCDLSQIPKVVSGRAGIWTHALCLGLLFWPLPHPAPLFCRAAPCSLPIKCRCVSCIFWGGGEDIGNTWIKPRDHLVWHLAFWTPPIHGHLQWREEVLPEPRGEGCAINWLWRTWMSHQLSFYYYPGFRQPASYLYSLSATMLSPHGETSAHTAGGFGKRSQSETLKSVWILPSDPLGVTQLRFSLSPAFQVAFENLWWADTSISPVTHRVCVCVSCSVVSDSSRSHGL